MSDRIIIPRASLASLRQLVDQIEAESQSFVEVPPAPPPAAPVTPPPSPPTILDAASAFRDYGAFYDWLRGNKMLGPRISPSEFEHTDRIIRHAARANWGISWVAYALATTYHETAHTMEPVKEIGGSAYFTRMYDIRGRRPHIARQLGNTEPGDGARFPGRGYAQLTGRRNHALATQKLRAMGINVDLVAEPHRAMEPEIAAILLIQGMRDGWYTGHDIDDDLPVRGPATRAQFNASRDIINGRDKADLIAGYAMDFQTALDKGGYLLPA